MKKEIYNVFSAKYGIPGQVIDHGIVIYLQFTYEGKDVQIALSRPFPCDEESLIRLGCKTITSYIDNLISEAQKSRTTKLHHWYIEKINRNNQDYLIAHGIVSGHKKLPDSIFINTSLIQEILIDEEQGEAIIQTQNTPYHCPLFSCEWKKQDLAPEIVPDYESLKIEYQHDAPSPTIEDGKLLLVLSNHDEYYFNNLYYKPIGADEPYSSTGRPHIGTFQDSFLIECDNYEIDIRYFPHFQNIEFYCMETDDLPFFIENIGDVTLYARTHLGTLRLAPGERKEVLKENMEKKAPLLPSGDLYPAAVIEESDLKWIFDSDWEGN